MHKKHTFFIFSFFSLEPVLTRTGETMQKNGLNKKGFSGHAQYIYEEELLYDTFPEDFVWGTATAAYQVTPATSK